MCEEKIPKVSVCVITYNQEKYIHQCLQSILDQDVDFDFEIIVGDDCSTDRTREILQEFADKYSNLVIPLFRKINMGGHGTQNWLDVMRRARGTYLAHIDGDDRMLPGKLQKQVNFLDRHLDCSIVGHDLRISDGETGCILSETFTNLSIPEKTDINFLLVNGCYFGHSSKMFRRSSIITQFRDKATVDFFMHVEQASKGNIGYINEILGEYIKSAKSNTDTTNYLVRQELVNGYYDAFNRALELGVNPAVVKRGNLLFNYSTAYSLFLANDYEGFKKFIHLDRVDYLHAAWKHRLFYRLHTYPILILLIIKLKPFIHFMAFKNIKI